MSEDPAPGTEPLTAEEIARIENMTNYDAEVLALAAIGQASRALATRTNDYNSAARSCGFENVEHEILAFLASDLFDLMVDSILDGQDAATKRTPLEYAQDVVDRAYGEGAITVVSCEAEPILSRPGNRPRGKRYIEPLSQTLDSGEDILGGYNRMIELEQICPDVVLLEIPLESIGVDRKEIRHASEICCIGLPPYQGATGRALRLCDA